MSSTNPDDPIAATQMREGLTKREHFAALNHAAILGKIAFDQDAEDMMHNAGIKTADIKAFAAFLAVDAADALIAALNA